MQIDDQPTDTPTKPPVSDLPKYTTTIRKSDEQGGSSTKNPKHLPSKTTREKLLDDRRKKTNQIHIKKNTSRSKPTTTIKNDSK